MIPKSSHLYRWLYTLFLAVDANFRLSLKDKGLTDIELGPGWSHQVEETRFQNHVATILDQTEVQRIAWLLLVVSSFSYPTQINTCRSQHDAILRANSRNKEGYLASGTALVQCARHGLVRKNGVGDLQKGEKYVPKTLVCSQG
jgi:hypothetical protein